MIVGKLNEAKKEQGLSLEQIAVLSNLSISTVKKIFSGAIENPKLPNLQAICSTLHLTLDDLCPTPNTEHSFSSEAQKIAKQYDLLPGESQELIKTIMDFEVKRMQRAVEAKAN